VIGVDVEEQLVKASIALIANQGLSDRGIRTVRAALRSASVSYGLLAENHGAHSIDVQLCNLGSDGE
jgi:hypothetical protein